ncbi:DNA-binding transcriptional regulator, AcrR family [Saccharopolyspora antimicrobica]|uniref:DNA-binding transcriptional regulator, AcrR family n=1 Tax=Saccharopolyspora antimicrobica TaxID=455193 RepID=A0A1I5JKB4_9PSEU|nr:TetR family transcriptional regulator [Saccharopolyspora antimicrobica]SFO73232.1 DNA-binding transcriptional regulator, AcrR family [Saccharopolyspora antimicrobica]
MQPSHKKPQNARTTPNATTTENPGEADSRVIRAAREVFAEQGFAAPMAEVAKRAGVGVASVYRRYPSKHELVEQVRIAGFRLLLAEAEQARAEESDPWAALVRFMRRCLREGSGIGTVLPPMDPQHVYSDEFRALQRRVPKAIEDLVSAAQRAGELRQDVEWPDILLLLKHLNPRLPATEQRRAELRSRYLGLVLEGLRPGGPELPGPPPDRAEWQALCDNQPVQ